MAFSDAFLYCTPLCTIGFGIATRSLNLLQLVGACGGLLRTSNNPLELTSPSEATSLQAQGVRDDLVEAVPSNWSS